MFVCCFVGAGTFSRIYRKSQNDETKKSSEQQFSGLSFSGLRQQLLKKPVVTTEVCTSHNMLNPEPDGLQAAEDYTSFCVK